MSWWIVVVHNTAKLDLQLQYLVVRSEMKTQKIHISEIALLLVESTSVSLTVGLLAELTRQKVKVIFCDHKRNPSSELISYYGSHDTSNKIRTQITWPQSVKEAVWTEIVREKINKQAEFLLERGKNTEAALLRDYVQQIQWNDATNREGHAAKVYFNALFGMDFSRSQDCPINAALNYGYSLMLSAINREIVMNGYITQLGLFHDNMFNQFNLGSDLMEPYRVLVDRKVCEMKPIEFEHEQKMKLVALLNEEIIMEGKHFVILNAIKQYVKSVFDALNESDIARFPFILMSYRYMRVIVMFDLPVLSSAQRREYTRFRKYLLKSGFVMQQESIYSKLALNTSIAQRIEDNVRKNKPPEGLVQMLTITEKQYGRMELLVGEVTSEVIQSDERLIIL